MIGVTPFQSFAPKQRRNLVVLFLVSLLKTGVFSILGIKKSISKQILLPGLYPLGYSSVRFFNFFYFLRKIIQSLPLTIRWKAFTGGFSYL